MIKDYNIFGLFIIMDLDIDVNIMCSKLSPGGTLTCEILSSQRESELSRSFII